MGNRQGKIAGRRRSRRQIFHGAQRRSIVRLSLRGRPVEQPRNAPLHHGQDEHGQGQGGGTTRPAQVRQGRQQDAAEQGQRGHVGGSRTGVPLKALHVGSPPQEQGAVEQGHGYQAGGAPQRRDVH